MMGYDDLEKDTPLFRDLYICTEFLHCTHKEFLDQPRLERTKMRMFLDVTMMKRHKEVEEIKSKNRDIELLKNAPEVE